MADTLSLVRPLGAARERRLQAALLARLERFSFRNHPALRVSPDLEGYRDFSFGGRAGPDCDFSHLAHELAHAAEFGPEQFRERGRFGRFNFHVHQVRVLGQMYDEPHTPQATQRECRTAGLQWMLLEMSGRKVHAGHYLESFVSTMDFMPDWVHSWGSVRREDAIRKLVLDTRESCRQGELIGRIEGWLDLNRQELAHKERKRYKALH